MKPRFPKLSVVVPTYRRHQELRLCLESIVSQSDTDIEILVGDNNPDGGARSVIDGVCRHRCIYLGSGKNVGPVANILRLLQAASGDWVLCLTDDDLLLPGAIGRLRAATVEHADCGVVMGPLRCARSSGEDVHTYWGCRRVGLLQAGREAICQLVPAAHILSGIMYRRTLADLKLFEANLGTLYPQVGLVCDILKSWNGYFLTQPAVHHTEGNPVHWQYSSDYMVGARLGMFARVLPSPQWSGEYRAMKTKIAEEIVRQHIPHAFSVSIRQGIRHQLRIAATPAISLSAVYWRYLFARAAHRALALLRADKP